MRKFINGLTACQGGTNAWDPLEAELLLGEGMFGIDVGEYTPSKICSLFAQKSFNKTIFLISDGLFTGWEQLAELVRSSSKHTRVFTFGVGPYMSKHVIRAIARAGGGFAEIISHDKRAESKVKSQIARSFQPALSNVHIEWGSDGSGDSGIVQQAPAIVSSLFNRERLVVYASFAGPYPTQATLHAALPDGTAIKCCVSISDLQIQSGNLIHRMWAKARIRDWEFGSLSEDCIQHEIVKEKQMQDIINISCLYQIASRFTSFIAIEERTANQDTETASPAVDVAKLVEEHAVDELSYMSWAQSSASNSNLSKQPPPKDGRIGIFHRDFHHLPSDGAGCEALLAKAEEARTVSDANTMLECMLQFCRATKVHMTVTQLSLFAAALKMYFRNMRDGGETQYLVSDCRAAVSFIRENILSKTKSYPESQVLFHKTVGDLWRYVCEQAKGFERDKAIKEAEKEYKLAKSIADRELNPTHPHTLELCVNLSVFYHDVMKNSRRAFEIAKQAFDRGTYKIS